MSRLTLEWHLRAIRDGVPDRAASTGFPTDGRTCDSYTVSAGKALRSSDPVAFLEAVANDPIKPLVERTDAASLLNHHIWPDSPDAGTLGRADGLAGHTDRPDIDFREWIDADLVRSNRPMYLSMDCANPKCTEGECLADPDVLRDDGVPVCMVCGTEQSTPTYP